MTTTGTLPQPASTYQLLLDAARTWPNSVATQWIPDPSAYTRCLAWTYADLAGTVTQIANALTALGVRRPDAVTLSAPNTSMLYATTLAAQAAGIAAARGAEMSSHLMPEVSAHLLAATPTAHWLEYVDWADAILEEPLQVVDGVVTPSDRPGVGLAWDEAKLRRLESL